MHPSVEHYNTCAEKFHKATLKVMTFESTDDQEFKKAFKEMTRLRVEAEDAKALIPPEILSKTKPI